MKIPEKAKDYIKNVVKNLKKGVISFSIKEHDKKFDIVVNDTIKTDSDCIIRDMEKSVENIKYGGVVIDIKSDVNNKKDININYERRERFNAK